MLDAPVVRRQPRYSSSVAVRQWEMTTENTSAKNKRASRYQASRSVRFTAIAFLLNYRLIKISRKRASRRVTHVGAFIYLSRGTHAHTRPRAFAVCMHISADLVNILCKSLPMPQRKIKIDFRTFQHHLIEFVGKLCEKIVHMVSLAPQQNTCFTY